jgi:hypothetical protein
MRQDDEHGHDPWWLLVFFGNEDVLYEVFSEIPRRYHHLNEKKLLKKYNSSQYNENFFLQSELSQMKLLILSEFVRQIVWQCRQLYKKYKVQNTPFSVVAKIENELLRSMKKYKMKEFDY